MWWLGGRTRCHRLERKGPAPICYALRAGIKKVHTPVVSNRKSHVVSGLVSVRSHPGSSRNDNSAPALSDQLTDPVGGQA
jgi:hypothetical protein